MDRSPSDDRGQPSRISLDIGFPRDVAASRCGPVGADNQAVAARRARTPAADPSLTGDRHEPHPSHPPSRRPEGEDHAYAVTIVFADHARETVAMAPVKPAVLNSWRLGIGT